LKPDLFDIDGVTVAAAAAAEPAEEAWIQILLLEQCNHILG
jgi:hypothetical protein